MPCLTGKLLGVLFFFNRIKKAGDGTYLMLRGSSFQSLGAKTEKASVISGFKRFSGSLEMYSKMDVEAAHKILAFILCA